MADLTSARFLLRPRWLLSHLLVIALVVVLVLLGFWQLSRLDQRQARNDLIEDRREEPVVPVEQLMAPGDAENKVDTARYRAVTATGTYDSSATVAVRNRTQDGVPGVWLVTPLVLDNGERVAVIRGFVRLGDDSKPAEVPPPLAPEESDGDVMVSGVVAVRSGFDGTAPRDIEPSTLPALILATESQPAEFSDDLQAVPMPDLSDGPHLSYAAQWFIFATIALVGYPFVLARVVRRRGKEVDDTPSDSHRDKPDGKQSDLDRELEALLRQET